MMKALKSLMIAAAVLSAGCSDNKTPFELPEPGNLRGSYELMGLSFDPQGILPKVELLGRVGSPLPVLVLATGGRAQLVVTDTAGLTTVVDGTYTMPHQDSVRVQFDVADRPLYSRVLLSQRMTLHRSSQNGALSFAGAAPDGISRPRFLQLAPEYSNEQLLDPVPGMLTMTWAPRLTAARIF